MIARFKLLVQRALVISRWLFAPTALVFLAFAAYRSRGAIVDAFTHARPWTFVWTVALCMLLHPLTAAFSWTVLRASGSTVPYVTLLSIQIRRLPARYLPGGIWQTVSRMVDLHHFGVDRARLRILVIMENLVPFADALVLGGLCLCLSGNLNMIPVGCLSAGTLLMTFIPLALSHRLLLKGQRFGPRPYFAAVGIITVFWGIASLAFANYWFAFPLAQTETSILRLFGAYLLSWSAGFAAVFAPQGIGVFESVAGLFLHGNAPTGEITTMMIGFRATVLAADSLVYGFYLLARHFLQQKHAYDGIDKF